MRFATYEQDGSPVRGGVVSDAGIHPLPDAVTVLDLVRAGLPAALAAGSPALGTPAVPLAAVRLLPPLEAPTSLSPTATTRGSWRSTCART
jgi:hypothetical protein